MNRADDAGALSTPHTTEGLVQDRDDLARILRGVQQLPDDRREALIMRFALGMDNREIARALDRTDGATKVLLHRAIDATLTAPVVAPVLRRLLDPRLHP